MNSKFFDLNKEKQDRVINAALKVFAVQGYRHGSTDIIVREAAISKGLLFHYFENKHGVYQFIYDYSAKYMNLELRANVSPKEKDLFAVVKQIERAKMNAMKGYPYMQRFLERSVMEDTCEALLAVEEKRSALEETYAAIHGQIDYDALPKGVDGVKLRKMMEFTIKGLMAERFQDASFQPEMLYREICDYVDMLREIVYRKAD